MNKIPLWANKQNLSKIANITAISYEKTKFAPKSSILSGIPIRTAKKYKKKQAIKNIF